MKKLCILQTNKQEFLNDCKKFQAYGVPKPSFKELQNIQEGELILLKLKHSGNESSYLGPYIASSSPKFWVKHISSKKGIWCKIEKTNDNYPQWINRFPWCVFLIPSEKNIDSLRSLKLNQSIPACKRITDPLCTQIINNLVQDEYLPPSKSSGYRTMRGVWVRSRGEYMIDNWFAEHGIVTYYERSIYIASVKVVPDWYIPSMDTFVEFLGLKGDPAYDNMWKKKERIYKNNGIKYVVLVDDDLADLDRSIPQKLPGFKAQGIQ
jgi:hypothetical protein